MSRLVILLVLISYSCSQSTVVSKRPSTPPVDTYSQDSLYLHFTGGFVNDSLVIEYSGIRMVKTGVNTNEASGFAMENILPSKGIDTIHVSLIRPHQRYSTEIINNGDNFIEVWYCKDDVLKHHCRAEPFTYE